MAKQKHTPQHKSSRRAIKELEMIGIELDSMDQDSDFYFIAGYTTNGCPYGITWDEHNDGLFDSKINFKPDFLEKDFYHIAGYTEDGEVFGVTWEEYLYSLFDVNMFQNSDLMEDVFEDEVNLEIMFGERED
jgi:hypothetical protein